MTLRIPTGLVIQRGTVPGSAPTDEFRVVDYVAGAPSVTVFPVDAVSSAGAAFTALLPHGGGVVEGNAAGFALADPNSPFAGVALAPFVAGGTVQVLTQGPLLGFSLGAGIACAVGVLASGALVRVTSVLNVAGLRYVGTCDAAGAVFVSPVIAPNADVRSYGGVADADGHGAGSNLGAVLTSMIALGLADIFIPSGNWRIATTVDVINTVNVHGAGGGVFGGPTNVYVDETVTAFFLENGIAQGSTFSSFWIGPVAKNINATTGAWDQASRSIDVAAVGDFATGQVVCLRGIGGQTDVPHTTGTVAMGSAIVAVTTIGDGLKVGMFITLGAAYPTATQIAAIGGGNFTMASPAAANATDAQVKYCLDLIARIESVAGAGPFTITLDDGATHVGSGAIPANASDVPLEHADTAFYINCVCSIDRVDVGGGPINGVYGFSGACFTVCGQTTGVPPSNTDLVSISQCYALHSRHAIYTRGDACNVCRFFAVSSVQSSDWSFVEAAFLGNNYVACHSDGGSGFVSTMSLANASVFLGCYMEGGTSSAFGLGALVLGGTMSPDEGGTSIVKTLTNQLSQQNNAATAVLQVSLAGFPDNGALGQYGAYAAWFTPDGFTWSWTIPQVPEFGFTHWQGLRIAKGVRSFAFLVPDASAPEYRDGGPPVWFPGGVYIGGASANRAAKALVWCDSAAPVAGTWNQGDRVNNLTPTELGVLGSKYILDHWICVAGGAPGTWLECRCLTGN